MNIDVLLPAALCLIVLAIVFVNSSVKKKITSLFGELKLSLTHVALLIVAMSVTVTVFVFIPEVAMQFFFLFAYAAILLLFTYLLTGKWYLGVPIPVVFIAVYLSPYWNLYFFNVFAVIFAVAISVYMGHLFTWKTTVGFALLLTIFDIIQVLVTGFIPASAGKALRLGLPVGIILPTFPSKSPYLSFLGLGDVFLFGLLSIQTTQKFGRKFGLTSVAFVTIVFFVIQTALLNFDFGGYPATVSVVGGWLAALGARYVYTSSVSPIHQSPRS